MGSLLDNPPPVDRTTGPHRRPDMDGRGEVYCADWCGAKCRTRAYEQACTAAAAMLAELGAGWEVRVWENMGWHAAVNKACCSVHAHFDGSSITGLTKDGEFRRVLSYTAYFNNEYQTLGKGATPTEAFREAYDAQLQIILKAQQGLDAFR